MPNFIFGFWSRASVMLKLPVPIMPTLPEPNLQVEGLAVLGAVALMDVAGLDHVALNCEHLA